MKELKFIAEIPDGAQCVGMAEYKGTIIIATTKGVYELIGNKLELIER